MFELEYYERALSPAVTKEMRRVVILRRYFCKRGKVLKEYDWLKLYKAINDFKLLFKFKYDIRTKSLSASYIPSPMRWCNQMSFFQFYLKLIPKFKWNQLNLPKLMVYLNKAKRACYRGLISQNKKAAKKASRMFLVKAAKITVLAFVMFPVSMAALATGVVFGCFLLALSRNPLEKDTLFTNAMIAFVLIESFVFTALLVGIAVQFAL